MLPSKVLMDVTTDHGPHPGVQDMFEKGPGIGQGHCVQPGAADGQWWVVKKNQDMTIAGLLKALVELL